MVADARSRDMPNDAQIRIRQVQDVIVIQIGGPSFSRDDGDVLQERVATLIAGLPRKVIVSFGAEIILHEEIVADLFEAARKIKGHGAALRFVFSNQRHRHVWAVTNLEASFPSCC